MKKLITDSLSALQMVTDPFYLVAVIVQQATNAVVNLTELFWDLSWYPETSLPHLIKSASGTG